MAEAYNVQEIEAAWQRRWLDEGTYEVDNDDPRPPFYCLSMYPYPSGEAHMGHVRNYTLGDVVVRHRTMHGYAVLSPMGWDSFGLPAENAAIKTGIHPREYTDARIAELKASVRRLGAAFDWRREIESHDPLYMRWNQWLFLRLLEAGLAYRATAPVNWCPGCQTVLANEQVLPDGTCERSGDVVTKRDLEQWLFKTTDYAQELLEDLDALDWPERVKTIQRNWIGRSEGAEFDLPVADPHGQPRGDGLVIRVFTTRPDTSFGMTYAVVAPEHPIVTELVTDEQREAVDAFVARVRSETEIERLSTEGALEKRGVFTGSYAVNPFNGRPVPVYLADYVLMGYGTGAIMAVPGEDQRDWDFAKAYGLEIIRTVEPPEGWEGEAYTGDGPAINSEWLDGLSKNDAVERAMAWLEEQGIGERKVNFRLRDWLVSRQRFWGCPIPVVYCPEHGIVPVPDDQLPVLLPDDVEFRPTGESPLKFHTGFLNTQCPRCGGPATRETDTMDGFVESSWYFFRYTDARNEQAAFDSDVVAHWLPVDQYIGGIEQAILHLMYARFFTKALADLGIGPKDVREPFGRLFNHGVVRLGGRRMSKSRGNIARPADLFESHGADALRLYHLFMAPPGDEVDWTSGGIVGTSRFLHRLWRLADPDSELAASAVERTTTDADAELERATHRLIARVSDEYERWSYNTAVAAFMEFTNAVYDYVQAKGGARRETLDGALDAVLLMLAPMTPHVCAELWDRRHGTHVHEQRWPQADPALVAEATVTMVVQVDGKVRDRIEVNSSIDDATAEELALASPKVRAILGDRHPAKVVARPPRLVNIVT